MLWATMCGKPPSLQRCQTKLRLREWCWWHDKMQHGNKMLVTRSSTLAMMSALWGPTCALLSVLGCTVGFVNISRQCTTKDVTWHWDFRLTFLLPLLPSGTLLCLCQTALPLAWDLFRNYKIHADVSDRRTAETLLWQCSETIIWVTLRKYASPRAWQLFCFRMISGLISKLWLAYWALLLNSYTS